ncbi:hypothetical protein JTM44_31115, partial [Pseudomonas aeruginosa]|nr:hypothetical protein [Pseudomonas aeruginosa]
CFFLLVNSASAKVICMGTDSVLTNWAILPRYAPGMGFVQRLPNLLPATAAGPAEDASAKRVGQFTDRPLRAEAESGAGCSNQSYLADYWSCFNKPLNF